MLKKTTFVNADMLKYTGITFFLRNAILWQNTNIKEYEEQY